MFEIKERLKQYLKLKQLSVREFERKCGLSNGVASRISLSTNPKTLHKISENSDLNIDWLLYDKGDMLKKNQILHDEIEIPSPAEIAIAEANGHWVPLVNIDSVGGVWSQNYTDSSEQYVERLVPFEGARAGDVAIYQSGESMSPTIPSGSILQIRKVDGWQEYFGYGQVYVLWLRDDRRITKLVRKYENDPRNYVLCCSYNPDVADEELPRSFIREVWKVVNILIPKGW